MQPGIRKPNLLKMAEDAVVNDGVAGDWLDQFHLRSVTYYKHATPYLPFLHYSSLLQLSALIPPLYHIHALLSQIDYFQPNSVHI